MIFNKASQILEKIHQTKLNQYFNLQAIPEWQKLYPLATKCGLNAKLIYLLLQILYGLLITKRKLKIFDITDDDYCNDCGQCETINHMLYDCNQVQHLLSNITVWIKKHIRDRVFLERFLFYWGIIETQ